MFAMKMIEIKNIFGLIDFKKAIYYTLILESSS